MVAPEDRGTLPRLAEATGRTKHLLLKDVRRNGLPCLERPQSRGGDYLFSKAAVPRWASSGSR